MSARTTDHEAILRAALHAAVDSLEPNRDGLELIRARLHQPRPASARLRAYYAGIVMRTPIRLQDVAYQVALWIRPVADWTRPVVDWTRPAADWIRLVFDRFAPLQAPGRHRSRTQGLLRPLAAMAVVMFIVAAGTYVAIDASTGIFPSSSSNAPSGGGPNTGGHSGAPAPRPSHVGGTQSADGSGHSAPSASCTPTPKASGSSSAPPPAPSASATSNPLPSESASVDTSTTPAAATSDSPAASASASIAPPPPPTTTSPSPVPVLTKPGC